MLPQLKIHFCKIRTFSRYTEEAQIRVVGFETVSFSVVPAFARQKDFLKHSVACKSLVDAVVNLEALYRSYFKPLDSPLLNACLALANKFAAVFVLKKCLKNTDL